MSLIHEGNINLNEFKKELSNKRVYGVSYINGNVYPFFPVGPSILAVPFVYLFDNFPRLSIILMPGFRTKELASIRAGNATATKYRVSLEKHIASFLLAFSTAILFATICRLSNIQNGLLVAINYAFGTSVWSTASRGLWQHGPSLFFLSLAMYVYLCRKNSNKNVFIFGVVLALSYIMRPTNSISVIAFAVLIFFTARKSLIPYFLGLALPLTLFVIVNLNIYDSILPPYFSPDRVGTYRNLLNALLGNLVSPNRGLFIFSPVLILSVVGAYIGFKDTNYRSFYLTISAIILLHLLVISSFPHWWGGHSYGPRFSSDMLIYLAALLLPFCQSHLRCKVPLIILLTIPSIIVHYRGANHVAVHRWNISPRLVDKKPERIWNWRDLQFLR